MALRINGEAFVVADSQRQRDAVDTAFETEGREATDVRLTDLGELSPAGRFRLRVDGDKLSIQRLSSVVTPGEYLWPSATTLMEISKDEVAFKVPIDLSSVHAFVGNILDTVPVETPSVVWLGDGYGPTEEPSGYLEVAVRDEGEEGVGYVPFWKSR